LILPNLALQPAKEADCRDKDHTAKSSDQNLPDDACGLQANQPGQPTADQAAYQPDNQVAYQSEAAPANHETGQPSGDDTSDYPDYEVHIALLSREVFP
jgi:hypothetical protein